MDNNIPKNSPESSAINSAESSPKSNISSDVLHENHNKEQQQQQQEQEHQQQTTPHSEPAVRANNEEGIEMDRIAENSNINVPSDNVGESSLKTISGYPSSKNTEAGSSSGKKEEDYNYRSTWVPKLHQELFENPEVLESRRTKQRASNYRKTLEREKEGIKPLDNILEELKANANGLTKAEAQKRLEEVGPNAIPDVKRYPILEFLYFMWNPLSWTMEVAAIVSIALLDWVDFILICALLLLNATIGFIEENTAGNAVEALKNSLVSQIRCMRDGEWVMLPSPDIVPGDVVMLKIGAIIPADCRVIEAEQVKIDQSSLTGESLPVTKKIGDEVYSGSAMKQGEAKCVVTATGVNTFFGRAPQIILREADNYKQVGEQVEKEIENLADRGYRALGVSVSYDAPDFKIWHFEGLIPLFDPPRHDTEDTIKRALEMGVSVKMITGDQLAIAKETARRLGMGGNLFTIPYLENNDLGVSEGEVIEMADGFAEMWPEHKYKVVEQLQKRKHVVGMTGDGVNDAPALKKAQIGIAVAGATDAARSVSDIVLTSSGLSVIIDAIIASRKIFQRMRNYVIYSVAATVRICTTFGILTVAWNFKFPTIATVIIAILNDGTMLTISKDRVRARNEPDQWNLFEVFTMALCYGFYLVGSTIVFFAIIHDGSWFHDVIHLRILTDNELRGLIYLQVSISGLATIFVSRSQGFSYFERPGNLVIFAFIMSQVVATFIGVYGFRGYPHDSFSDDPRYPVSGTNFQGCGWGWAVCAWIWCFLWYIPMDFIKLGVTYILRGKIEPINKDALRKIYGWFGKEIPKEEIQVSHKVAEEQARRNALHAPAQSTHHKSTDTADNKA
ncbi:hypothetical protein RB653_006510 [Dictyostelium firmibasis]|uniref:Proton pump n=1 Tax=Dictyostelium firmibasis TaxID=79012 RepID=A0AAN7U9F8_9MYCE